MSDIKERKIDKAEIMRLVYELEDVGGRLDAAGVIRELLEELAITTSSLAMHKTIRKEAQAQVEALQKELGAANEHIHELIGEYNQDVEALWEREESLEKLLTTSYDLVAESISPTKQYDYEARATSLVMRAKAALAYIKGEGNETI